MKGVSSTAGFIQYQYRPSSLKLAKITDQSDPKMLGLEGGLVKEKTFLSQSSSNFYASIHSQLHHLCQIMFLWRRRSQEKNWSQRQMGWSCDPLSIVPIAEFIQFKICKLYCYFLVSNKYIRSAKNTCITGIILCPHQITANLSFGPTSRFLQDVAQDSLCWQKVF